MFKWRFSSSPDLKNGKTINYTNSSNYIYCQGVPDLKDGKTMKY